jgi:CRP-like cAMP-binding protein
MEFEVLPPIPAVTSARQLRQISLFAFASVDELFRFSAIAKQVRHKEGGTLQKKGAPADFIQVLLEGKASVSIDDSREEEIRPPALLGFREVLEGTPLRQNVRARESSICLALSAEDFRTLISDNIELAAGLFRMLLEPSAKNGPPSLLKGAIGTDSNRRSTGASDKKESINTALLLQELPIFRRANAEELLHLAGIAREVELAEGNDLFGEGDPPSIWVVLEGEISVTGPEKVETVEVSAGDALGIDETLAGQPLGWRGQVRRGGTALRIDREPLFDLLSHRGDLLQGIFGTLFQSSRLEEKRNR